ncbi:MAG: hypothetical protein RLZZ444_2419 [Pseudomonadota bacterium]
MTVMAAEAAPEISRGEFRGNASEYFGIWIVNILLTIVTFGIYSAWAKVRRKRYFYGNTYLANDSFDYHATGKQIFIGRLIVFVVLAIINVLSTIFPLAGIVTPILFLTILPWFVVRSLRFNARVTSYRNIRFDFTGKAWGAFVAIVLGSLVSFLSLGILAPLASRWANRYIFNHLRYGDRSFASDPHLGKLYGAWFAPAIMVFIGLLLMAIVGWLLLWPMFMDFAANIDDGTEQTRIVIGVALIYAILIPVVLVYLAAGFIYRVGVRNVVLNATRFDTAHELVSDLSRLRYLWIMISNLVVTVVTFSLMRPWAAVREQRYVVAHTGIRIDGDIGEVMASIEASGSAISAEYMDMEGFDFGF